MEGKVNTDHITQDFIVEDAIIGCCIQTPYEDAKSYIETSLWDFKPSVNTDKEDQDKCNDRFLDDYKGNH